MIALDTNVLLRYLLQDDLIQSEKATRLIENNPKALLTDVVLVETIWTLKNKKYNLDKPALLTVIEALIQEFCFEDNLTVWTAFNDYRDSNAGFADALIANKAKFIAKQKATKLRGVYTFDTAAQPLEGMLAIE